MEKAKQKLLKNKFLVFMITLFLVGTIVGMYYFLKLPSSTQNEVLNSISHVKDINPYLSIINNQLILIIIIIVMSFSIIGFPVIIFIFFYQSICLSFTATSFIYFFGIKGILFFLIYFICFYLIYYFALFYLTNLAYKMTILLISAVKKKIELNLGDFLRKFFTKFLVIISMLLLFNTLVYFLGSKLVKLFIFLL